MTPANHGSRFPNIYEMFHNNLISVSQDHYGIAGLVLQLFYYPPLHVSETGDLTAMRFNLYAQVEDAIAHARTKFDVIRIDIGIVNDPSDNECSTVEAHLYLTVTAKDDNDD